MTATSLRRAQEQPSGKADRTRALILAAAARLFRDEGHDATTMRRIAAAAHLEAGSVYYHFDSKDTILDEVLRLGVQHVFDAVRQAQEEKLRAGAGFRPVFAAMIGAHLGRSLRESDFSSANIRTYSRLPDTKRAPHRPLRRAYAALWDTLLESAQASGELAPGMRIGPLREFVLGAMNWTVEWYDARRHPVEVLSERLARLLLDGMMTRRGPLPAPAAAAPEVFAAFGGSKSLRTRLHLLAAAARVFRDRGFRAATMREVAREAGIQAGSIYYHFGSKDEMLDEVLEAGLHSLQRGMAETIADMARFPDHRSRIATAIGVHLEYVFRLSDLTSANVRIYGQLPETVRARHRPLRRAYGELWDGWLREAQQAGELRPDIKIVPLRQAMLGALNWTIEWFDPGRAGRDGACGLPELTVMLQRVLLDGIGDAGGQAGGSVARNVSPP